MANPPQSSLQSFIPLIVAGLSAITAIASATAAWISLRLNTRMAREGVRPILHLFEWEVDQSKASPVLRIRKVKNLGRSPAYQVTGIIIERRNDGSGATASSFLRSVLLVPAGEVADVDWFHELRTVDPPFDQIGGTGFVVHVNFTDQFDRQHGIALLVDLLDSKATEHSWHNRYRLAPNLALNRWEHRTLRRRKKQKLFTDERRR